LTSCNHAPTPTSSPSDVMETAISVAFTEVSETQIAIPTIAPSPTPTLVFPVISHDNVSQISEIGKWRTDFTSKPTWSDDSTKIFIPDLNIIYDINLSLTRQMLFNEYKKLNPIIFTDEVAEQGNCSKVLNRQTYTINSDKTIMAIGWSYGYAKTIVNLWDVAEKKCLLKLPELYGALPTLGFSSSGNYLVISTDRAIYVWSVKESEITCQVNYATDAIIYPAQKDVMVLSDALGGAIGENKVRNGLWDIKKCEKIQDYSFGMTHPTFNPNGDLLIGTLDNRLIITNAKTREVLKEIKIPDYWYFDILFSPDGRFMLSIYDDGNAEHEITFTLWAIPK